MASQRITVAKIAGLAAKVALLRLQTWSAARRPNPPNEWSPAQWPQPVRAEADEFANRLRAHAFAPPVVYFAEWADLWSVGDLCQRWLSMPGGPLPVAVYADQHEIFAYALPDGGRLAQHLASAGPQQWPETDWFIARLREAIETWREVGEEAVLAVFRRVMGPSVLDVEVTASLQSVPDWLA